MVGELWRRSAIRVLMFIAAAGVVVWVVWPGSSSDAAVLINRIAVPLLLGWMALLPTLVRHFYGPVRDGWLPRAARVFGYLVVLALITGYAVATREAEKLGAYFGDGETGVPVVVAGPWFALTLACYTAAILILTSHRVSQADPSAAAGRDRSRHAHRRGAVRALQLSPVERGQRNGSTAGFCDVVGGVGPLARPASAGGLLGCATRGP